MADENEIIPLSTAFLAKNVHIPSDRVPAQKNDPRI